MFSLLIPADCAMFPNGPTVHLYDDYAQASFHHDVKTLTLRSSDDGRTRLFWMTSDAAELQGLNPAAFVDHTTRPWPEAARHVIEVRRLCAGAPIRRVTT